MHTPSRPILLPAVLLFLPVGVGAKDYTVPPDNVAGFFADLPEDATRAVFSAAAVYRCNVDIVLPQRRMLIIDGAGCRLVLGPNSNGFTMHLADQKEAQRRTGSRYVIRDFGAIEGGRKAIDLKATLGSAVINCRLVGQTEAAVDLRFCLMARLELLLVTNPKARGIVVRQGDWPGASATNSQSNSTVLEQCRVYCTATTTQAFAVLNSGGVRMADCISEGGPPDHDLFLSAVASGEENALARNPVVKSFTLSNFHVEHKARRASIHVNMPPGAAVDISNVYWNGPQTAPVVLYVSGQLNLSNIGWFRSDFRMHTRVSTPSINIDRCHGALSIDPAKGRTATRVGVLELVDPILGSTTLKLDRVRITRASL